MKEQTFIGKGKVLVAKVGAGAAGFKDTGNCTKAEYSVQTEKKSVPQNRIIGGGEWAALERPTSVEITLELSDWSDENLQTALGASISTAASGTVASELVPVVSKDSYVLLSKIPTAITTVKSEDGVTTYDAGTDYVLDPFGLYIPADSTITIGTIDVSFSHGKQSTLELLQATGQEFQLAIVGLNEVHTEQLHRIVFNKAKVSPSNMSFIADDFGSISVKFTILVDAFGKFGSVERVS